MLGVTAGTALAPLRANSQATGRQASEYIRVAHRYSGGCICGGPCTTLTSLEPGYCPCRASYRTQLGVEVLIRQIVALNDSHNLTNIFLHTGTAQLL